MLKQRWILVVLVAVGLVGPTWAGPFSFLRRNKQNQPAPMPAQQRVAELITTLKTDQDGGRRTAAAEELRDQDPRMNPELIPVLIEAAQRDAKPEVRLAAVQSLGKFRPVSADVGRVIEQVVNSDSSMRVRMSARSTLWQYQLAGYRGGNAAAGQGPPLGSTQEPPLAEPGQAGPPLTPPADVTPGPQLYPQPMPRGPELYPVPSPAPTPPRVAPVPAYRPGPTSHTPPPEWPALQTGTPLSNYRLIQPQQPRLEGEIEPAVAPLHHEEIVPDLAPPSAPVVVPAPVPPLEVAPPVVAPAADDDSGPVLNGPQ